MKKNELYNMVISGQVSPHEAADYMREILEEEKKEELTLFQMAWEERDIIDAKEEKKLNLFTDLSNMSGFLDNLEKEDMQEPLVCVVKVEKFDFTGCVKLFQGLSALHNKFFNLYLCMIAVYNNQKQDKAAALAQAFGSLGASMIQEMPTCIIKSIGVESDIFENEEKLKNIIQNEISTKDFWVCYSDKRYVKTTKVLETENTQSEPHIRDDKVYLITGGLGSLGMLLAKKIVKEARPKIILTGRRILSQAEEEELEKLRETGSIVQYLRCNIDCKEEVENLIYTVKKMYSCINGIFYTAGICKDTLLVNKSKQEIEQVLATKIKGVIALDEETKKEKLDFFIMYSSISSVIGNIGQTDYGFANGFLDAYAFLRNTWVKQGLRSGDTVSINWPLWEEGNMRPDENSVKWMKNKMGFSPLPTTEGIPFLLNSMNLCQSQVMVTYGNNQKIKQSILGEKEKMLLVEQSIVSETRETEMQEDVLDTEELLKDMINYLKNVFAVETRMDVSRIDETEKLEKYGLDSVLIINLTRTLEKKFGVLSKTLFYEYQTIEELAGYFGENKKDEIMATLKKKPVKKEVLVEKEQLVEREQSAEKAQSMSCDKDMKVAVIGISGKYPLANDLEEFWENLKSGKDCITEIPKSRFNIDEIYSEKKGDSGTTYSKWGGFIDGVDEFDPLIFQISPREAKFIDPQERLFLENAWHTFEDAGYPKKKISGKKVGVYVGVMYGQYQLIGVEESAKGNYMLGNSSFASIANRVSFYFDLRGPSIALDTMCSSSLTAIHLALDSLKKGECEMALAGGVNLAIHKSKYLQLSEQKFASSNGKCMAFGEGGDGYVPGEGVGSVLLKPYEKAIEDNDPIYAVVKASVVNHGGRTNGYTVPNPVEQGNLIQTAIKQANISACDIQYIEAHGTGTSLGDPIEINGLLRGFQEAGSLPQNYCAIGSVKSNIGHLESAAGIASITKVILQLQHKQIVPSLHSEILNPNINFSETLFYVPQKVESWKVPKGDNEKQKTRIAGISAFGAGGSNAHIIVEEYVPDKAGVKQDLQYAKEYIIPFSAHTKETLIMNLQKMEQYINLHQNEIELADLSYTLLTGRETLKERVVFLAENMYDLLEKIRAYVLGGSGVECFSTDNPLHLFEIPAGKKQEQEMLHALIQEENYRNMCYAWVHMKNPDFDEFSRKLNARIVYLPGYIFAKDRYWLPVRKADMLEFETAYPESMDKDGVVLKWRFDKQNLLLDQHRVNGIRILPGAAYIEMCFKVMKQFLPKSGSIQNITWVAPFVLDETEKKEMFCFVQGKDNNLKLMFKSGSKEKETLHAICNISLEAISAEHSHYDMQKLKTQCSKTLEHTEIYDYFQNVSIDYGKYFRSNQEVFCGVNESLAKIFMDKEYKEFSEECTIPVNVLDAAFQSTIGILSLADTNQGKTVVPYSTASVSVYRKISRICYSYMKVKGNNKFDIELLDEQGSLCAKIQDFQVKSIDSAPDNSKEAADVSGKYFVQEWTRTKVSVVKKKEKQSQVVIFYQNESMFLAEIIRVYYEEQSVSMVHIDEHTNYEAVLKKGVKHIYFLGGFFQKMPLFKEAQEYSIIAAFRMIKAVIKNGLCRSDISIINIGNKTLNLFGEKQVIPYAAAIFGFLKSFAKEQPKCIVRNYDLECEESFLPEDIAEEIVYGNLSGNGEEAILRNGNWYQRALVEAVPIEEKANAFRENGTYVILGGAGGIGFTLCEKLVKEYKAHVILLGRSNLSNEKQEHTKELIADGGSIDYIRADASSLEEMKSAVRQIKQKYGVIHGVIHSAIVLEDHNLLVMDESCLRRVLAPKMVGTINLFESIKEENLDFLMFFSSAQALTCNPAQSNYSAGCAFKDAFAGYIDSLALFPVKIMNWGYWGQVGVVSSREYVEKLRSQGIYSIKQSEGMDAVTTLLKNPYSQLMYMKAEEELFDKLGINEDRKCQMHAQNEESVFSVLGAFNKPVRYESKEENYDSGFSKMNEYMLQYLVHHLKGTGVFDSVYKGYLFEELMTSVQVIPMYHRLFDEILEILRKNGYISYRDEKYYVTDKFIMEAIRTDAELLQDKQDIMKNYPNLYAQMRLLGTCLEHLDEILLGKVLATEIMFPNASMELVNDIYKGNEIVDRINELAVETVRKYIETRLKELKPGEKISILEVGSGTGGTSQSVFKAVNQWADKISYHYTDISFGFINYGKKTYGKDYSFIDFSLLDIEKNVEEQGYKVGVYDIVLAANVIHATKNLNHTLKNVKYLLKRNGWFILNEATQKQDFLTLTFGLTEGWWLYEDSENRLKNAPLLNPALWEAILLENGYRNIAILGSEYLAKSGVSQNIVVAESDGRMISESVINTSNSSVYLETTERKVQIEPVMAVKSSVGTNEGKEDFVKQVIKESLCNILQIEEMQIDSETPFSDFGVDSIMAVEVINAVNDKLNITLNATDLFNYATVDELTKYICAEFFVIMEQPLENEMEHKDNKVPMEASKEYIKKVIEQALADVLQIEGQQLGNNQPFSDFGVDSIMAVEVIQLINDNLKIELQIIDLFNYATIDVLMNYIYENFKVMEESDPVIETLVYDSFEDTNHSVEKSVEESVEERETDVAIVGISGYFPEADDIEQLWENLCAGRNSVREITRWKDCDFFSEDSNDVNKSYSKWGGFLKDIKQFDPHFFGISPKEAELMDPQQRLFLMEAWKAFEDAGYSQHALDGRKCGVYVGCGSGDYRSYLKENNVKADAYSFMGNDDSILASRIAYILNLKGESIAINTACSSSLLAIHMACESIRNGKAELALAGGVTVLTTPEFYIMASTAGMLSPTGECRAFDQGANGFVPGEGVGAVVLKSLKAAKRDHDHIYGVITGSGSNQDGKTNGITAPSAPSQASLEKEVYEKFNINPKDITYVETHGTGTKLGDPIEITALTDSFTKYTKEKGYCALGSIKTNIGHTLSAAGVSSFIKVILCLKHKMLVPSIHLEQENEYINFKDSPFYVNTKLTEWKSEKNEPLQAAISSFGFSGTNVHMVVKEFKEEHVSGKLEKNQYYPIMISTKNKKVLRKNVEKLLQWLESTKNCDLGNLSYTLATARNHFKWRVCWTVKSIEELKGKIKDFLENWKDDRKDDRKGSGNQADQEKATALIKDIFERNFAADDAKADMEELMELYEAGMELDFSLLFKQEDYLKVTLPANVFNLDSFWPDITESDEIVQEQKPKRHLHPLIDRNVSSFTKNMMETYFTGEEYYMNDHVVGKQKILLGVACVEMARAAGEMLLEEKVTSIRNITFLCPVTSELVPCNLQTELFKEKEKVVFNIKSKDHSSLIFTRGELGTGESRTEMLDISRLFANCPKSIEKNVLYDGFCKKEIHYGPSFQSIERISYGEQELIARIELPACRQDTFSLYGLHPSIMDAALQSVTGLLGCTYQYEEFIYLPFHIGEISILQPLTRTCYAYVKESKNNKVGETIHYTIYIMDVDGMVEVIIDDFSLRAMGKNEKERNEVKAANSKKVFLKNVWRERSMNSSNERKKNIFVLDENSAVDVEMLRKQEITIYSREGVYALRADKEAVPEEADVYFELNQNLENEDSNRFASVKSTYKKIEDLAQVIRESLKLKDRINGIAVIVTGDRNNPQLSAIGSMFRIIAAENKQIHFCVIYIGDSQFGTNQICWMKKELNQEESFLEVQYENGTRYVKELETVDLAVKNKLVKIRQNGTYVITGGMGSVGRIFAKYLLAKGARVILIGHSDLTDERKKVLNQLSSMGSVVYKKVNLVQREEVLLAMRQILNEYQTIHGVIHSAGVIKDGLFVNNDVQDFASVIHPKVYGAYLLDEALKDCELDFFFLCSSMAAKTENIGQSVYGYANCVLDEWASQREMLTVQKKRHGVTVSVNWSLWKNGGMSISKQKEDSLLQMFGLKPMEDEVAMEVFEIGLQSGESNFMVLYGEEEQMNSMHKTSETEKNDVASKEIVRSTMQGTMVSTQKETIINEVLVAAVEEALKIKQEDIDFEEPLSDFGFDSISFTDFCNYVNSRLDSQINPSDMFEFKSLKQFEEYLCKEVDVKIEEYEELPEVVLSEPEYIDEPKELEKLERKTEIYEEKKDSGYEEAIAIIGMSGKFPESEDLEEFWNNLRDGKDMVTTIPSNRWDWRAFYGEPKTEVNKTNVIWGGFMKKPSSFDPLFFGISPREAELMDPQHRILLESVWNTIEDAGYKVSDLSGKDVGLYVGVSTSDYCDLIKERKLDNSPQVSTGNSHSILVNRISYLFDFHGPSVPIDTACSSSLVSLHMAVTALRKKECSEAIVGGVNVIVSPSLYISFSKSGMLSPDGKCKTFDESANGYARGEGVGTILLKPLSEAVKAKDHIYGVIRATAVNHGGHSNSLTAPNPEAQSNLIYQAWTQAGIGAETIGYMEAHGTGTSLGDPIEINGLKKAFTKLYEKEGKPVPTEAYCGIGSVKSNIGHLEAASGMAGIIKVLLAMKYKQIPASIHIKKVNPYINLTDTPFYLAKHTTEWNAACDSDGKILPRRAGVSSFGFGGVNAHVVLEEYKQLDTDYLSDEQITYCVPISAKSEEQRTEYVRKLLSFLQKHPEASLASIAYIFETGREAFEYRVAFLADSKERLMENMERYLENKNLDENVIEGYYEKVKGETLVVYEEIDGNLKRVAADWVNGAIVNWNYLYKGRNPKRISLPTYPFAEERYWIPSNTERKELKTAEKLMIEKAKLVQKYQAVFPIYHKEKYIHDHVVHGEEMLPGAVYLEYAKAYAEHVLGTKVYEISNVSWDKAFVVSKEEKDIQLDLNQEEETTFSFSSMEDGIYASGNLSVLEPDNKESEAWDIGNELDMSMSGEQIYRLFSEVGINYGTSYQVLEELHCNMQEGKALLRIKDELEKDFTKYALNPSIIDGAFQSVMGILINLCRENSMLYLPFALKKLKVYQELELECIIQIRRLNRKPLAKIEKFNIQILNTDRVIIAEMEEFMVIGYEYSQTKEEKQHTPKNLLELFVMVESGEISIDDAETLMEVLK